MINNTMKATPYGTRRHFRIRKLPTRYAAIVMPFVLSIFMTCVVSAIATLRSVGFVDGVQWLWLQNWGLSWAVAFPTLLVILPLVRRVVALLVAAPQGGWGLVFPPCMARPLYER